MFKDITKYWAPVVIALIIYLSITTVYVFFVYPEKVEKEIYTLVNSYYAIGKTDGFMMLEKEVYKASVEGIFTQATGTGQFYLRVK